MYSYSYDEETFTGEFATREEAIKAAFAENPTANRCFTGQNFTPKPEDYVSGDDVIEQVACNDAFLGEWAEDWPEASKEQRAELTAALQKVMAEWLDKHNLRPAFFNVEEVEEAKNPTFD